MTTQRRLREPQFPEPPELRWARRACGWAGALGLALLLAGPVGARPLGDADASAERACERVVDLAPAQRGVSLQEATRRATQQYPGGRVVRAVTIEDNGRRVHEIRILLPPEEGGRVVTVRIDAGNGR